MIEATAHSPRQRGDEVIRIRGAREHNLQNIDLDIPRDRLVVITGPSGCGKSSLAVDTLCAEGQRQYVESLSVYARQFLDQMQRPDVDLIEGLQPTIVIDQRAANPNPRSTVATVTEVYDYLRLLYARLGLPHCYKCGAPVQQQTPEQICESLARLPEGTRAMILAPLVRGRKGAHQEVFAAIHKAGFVRARVNGEIYDIEDVPELAPRRAHHIEAVVDRIVIREGIEQRLRESVDLAVHHGEDMVIVCHQLPGEKKNGDAKNKKTTRATKKKAARKTAAPNGRKAGNKSNGTKSNGGKTNGGAWQDILYSTQYACGKCGISYEELEPRTFSFNSPYGACAACDGLGHRVEFDPELIVPDRELSLADGAVVPWKGLSGAALKQKKTALSKFLAARKFDWDTPLAKLSEKTFEQLLRGTNGSKNEFIGVLNLLEKEFATTKREARQQKLAGFRGEVPCVDCGGSRLRAEARNVTLGGLAIHEVAAMPVNQAIDHLDAVTFDEADAPIFMPILNEIVNRLQFLAKVGVHYLSLDRRADTLSGGELQRVRLATGIGSGLVGVCYVLDEPSIGLHPRDNQLLIEALRDLQNLGNSVLVVEHDQAMMTSSDHLIDMGPGAGLHGGQIVAQGSPDDVTAHADSITGKYLAGELSIPVPSQRRRAAKSRSLTLLGAALNNLQDVDAMFPLGTFTCVTGVSGSGKSSLVNGTLVRALARRLTASGPKPGPHRGLRGAAQIDKLVPIDQSPIGRSPRSNPATYTGVFDEVRKVFAGTREAKQRGFGVGRFSFNVSGGRCEACQGQGQQKIDMNFLPDLYVTCNECGGARFNRQTLSVKYRDMSIADVLNLRIEDARETFENFASIERVLGCLVDVGLGYLKLGQSSITLSGGEAQRIKLATELARVDTGNTLYVLDEPTTGLHFDDIRKLLEVLNRLVDLGNTVLVIEHNLDVIKAADWIVDLGPEGGADGGQIVATGTPEEIAAIEENHTGRALRDVL
ncbi:MAG: excinuclease ABC subunit UvrA [Planctomycetota bacterium]|nr:MAG: excinuclease ABC subunit UvrA [Planctomycetota bacterium]